MNKIPTFDSAHLKVLSRCLGEIGTGSDIDRVLQEKNIIDNSGVSTKWRRLYSIFMESQKKYKCSNQIIDFIRTFFQPVNFIEQKETFETHREELNKILVFSGLTYESTGQICYCKKVQTLDEVEKSVKTIRSKLRGRKMHAEVLKYCKSELMQDNLFHAVFEASKGLAERIREKSKIDEDGTFLVDKVFSIEQPLLAFNKLQTDTEKSEHKGFASLLKGCFSAFRNPTAHQPKILWQGDEDDIIDCFSLISFLHRRLDRCVPTKK